MKARIKRKLQEADAATRWDKGAEKQKEEGAASLRKQLVERGVPLKVIDQYFAELDREDKQLSNTLKWMKDGGGLPSDDLNRLHRRKPSVVALKPVGASMSSAEERDIMADIKQEVRFAAAAGLPRGMTRDDLEGIANLTVATNGGGKLRGEALKMRLRDRFKRGIAQRIKKDNRDGRIKHELERKHGYLADL